MRQKRIIIQDDYIFKAVIYYGLIFINSKLPECKKKTGVAKTHENSPVYKAVLKKTWLLNKKLVNSCASAYVWVKNTTGSALIDRFKIYTTL